MNYVAAVPITRTGKSPEASKVVASSKSAASPIEKAIQAGRQVYDPIVDGSLGESLDPILTGHTGKMRGNIERWIVPALLKLWPDGTGRADAEDIWDALRTGMKSEDMLITDMTPEALKDLFGGERVSLDNVIAALINFRTLLASRKFDFNRYRKATKFHPLPAGFCEMVRDTEEFKSYLRETRQSLSSSGGLKRNLENLRSLNIEPDSMLKQFERVAATLAWAEFIEHCDYNGLELEGLDLRDELIAARIAKMFIDYANRRTDPKAKDSLELLRRLSEARAGKIAAEIAFLRKLSEADFWKRIEAKRDAARRPDISLQGIDLTNDRVWEAFVKEFFGGRKDLSVSEIQETLRNMSAQKVAEKLAALRKLTSELKSQMPVTPGVAAPAAS